MFYFASCCECLKNTTFISYFFCIFFKYTLNLVKLFPRLMPYWPVLLKFSLVIPPFLSHCDSFFSLPNSYLSWLWSHYVRLWCHRNAQQSWVTNTKVWFWLFPGNQIITKTPPFSTLLSSTEGQKCSLHFWGDTWAHVRGSPNTYRTCGEIFIWCYPILQAIDKSIF